MEEEEEVKKGKGLKIFESKQIKTRLSVLLAQIKSENNSWKLINEIREIQYILYQHSKMTKRSKLQ